MYQMSIQEAARILSITEDAVRKRLSKGKLSGTKDKSGRWIVYLDTIPIQEPEQSGNDPGAERYIKGLEREIEFLRTQLEYKDKLLSQALNRIPLLEQPKQGIFKRLFNKEKGSPGRDPNTNY